MTTFVFDASYPSLDIALPLEPVPHLFIADRPIDPPPGHLALQLDDRAGLLAQLRQLRQAWRAAGGRRSIVIGGARPGQLLRHLAFAGLLGGPVALVDAGRPVPLGRAWRRVLRAALVLVAGSTLRGLRDRWLDRRLRRSAPKTAEGRLYGRHHQADSIPLPPDRLTALPPGLSLYGQWSGGWYLPKFSHAPGRWAVTTTRHRLGPVALHVEAVGDSELSSVHRDGRLIAYPYMVGPRPIQHTHAVRSTRRVTHAPGGTDLLYFTAGYYHWVIEGIPRVLDVLDDGIDLDRFPLCLPPLAPYQREFLVLMGIDPARQVVTLDKGDWCHLDECLFPTAYFPFGADGVEDPSGWPDTQLLHRIRERVLARLPVPPAATGTRLYVSRAAAAKRKLTAASERALVAALEPLGFEKVVLEALPWVDQVRLFAGADFIVAPHGAGLANLPFSRARALVEIHNPQEARAYFATIARELGMEYGYVVAGLEGRSPCHDNLTVDAGEIAALIRRIDAAL
jgi:capsular polysaccharide biosynthesis protein